MVLLHQTHFMSMANASTCSVPPAVPTDLVTPFQNCRPQNCCTRDHLLPRWPVKHNVINLLRCLPALRVQKFVQ